MTKANRIIGVGSPVVDQVISVSEDLLSVVGGEKGGMELVDADTMSRFLEELPDADTRQPGGSAGNTTFALAKLGMRCRFLGMVGSDEAGNFYKDTFWSLGGDHRSIRFNSDLPTAQCLSLVTPDGERTMRTHLGAAMGLEPAHIDRSDFAGCRHAHIEGYLLFNPELLTSVLDAAKQAGCRTSLDLASFEVVAAARDILPELLDQYVDMVFANEEEAQTFAESDDNQTCLNALRQHCNTVALKRGAQGALLYDNGKTVEIPAIAVPEAVDTTGAGDFWAAGFLFGNLQGKDIETAGQYGAHLGASVVQEMGATIPEDKWRNIFRTIAETSPAEKQVA